MRNLRGYLAVALLPLTAAAAWADEEKKIPWKISGQLEEACSCDAACPCWFDSKPSRMHCSGGQVVFIEKGTYGGVSLDGMAIAQVGQSPDGETMIQSFGNWDFVNLYIDEKANPEQRKALEEIGKTVSPLGAPPERTQIKYVPITRRVEGSEHIITIGTIGSFSGHLIPGGMGGNPKIVNPPGADPIHREYQQGRTTKQTYTDSGQKWDWSNTNYMFATFETNSDEYEKYIASLTQQMEKMKTEKKTEKKGD